MIKNLSKVLPAVFWSAFATAIIFLIVVLVSTAFSKQLDKPVTLIKSLLISPVNNPPVRHEVIGFLPSWNAAKEVKIDTSNLTQIIYFGFGVNSTGDIIRYDQSGNEVLEWIHFNSPYFKKIRTEAKKTDTKILVAIKNFDNKNIDDLISNPTLSDKFISQIAKLISDNNLDGVNIDFEYFTDSNFPTSKHLNAFFVKLSQKLRADKPDLTISADFGGSSVVSDPAYDMVKLGEVLDQIILMGYDYSTAASTQASPVAPLYSNQDGASIDKSIKSLKGRVPLEKVVLAIPFYGYEWQTVDASFQSPTIPETGALATYERVLELMNGRKDIEINWDNVSQTPWLTYSQSGANKQIYFENEQSIAKKLDYIKKMNLDGVGIWAIGYEGDNENFWQVIKKSGKAN